MEIQLGVQLGMLHQQLGITPDARVTYEFRSTGVIIRNWSTGVQYTVNPPNVEEARFNVPAWVKEIFEATDDVLKQRWKNGQGWTNERGTIFTELTCRGVRIRDFPELGGQEDTMETTFKFNERKVIKSSSGISPEMFNDDLTFTFEAKDVHWTDPKELDKMFAELDFAVSEVKKSWRAKRSGNT